MTFFNSLGVSDTMLPEDVFSLLGHADSDSAYFFDTDVGPIVTELGTQDSNTPKKCYWASRFHRAGEGPTPGQAGAALVFPAPPLEARTQEYPTLESNGSKTVSLPVTFTYTNTHTGVSQVDNTWVTSGNGSCFLRRPRAIVEESGTVTWISGPCALGGCMP